MPKISVVIVTYNRAKLLPEAIDSVFNQTYKDYELIIVDDGSTDNTRDVVKGYGNKVRYFYQENQGISAARNKGILEAKGEYIAFIDSDDVWFSTKLQKQVEVAEKTGVGLVHTARYETNIARAKEPILLPTRPARSSAEYLSGKTQISMTVLVKKNALMRGGMFDVDLSSSNDRDMWLRVAKNEEIVFIEEPLMDVRIHSDNISRKWEQKYSNRIKIAKKMLLDDDQRIVKSVWRGQLASNYYLLGILKYKKEMYKESLSLTLRALAINLFVGWSITYSKDALLLKLKILLSPYSLLLKGFLKRGKAIS